MADLKSGAIKKKVKKTKIISIKPKAEDKKKKTDKVVTQFIEANKPKTDESMKVITFMAKKIIENLIECAVSIKE